MSAAAKYSICWPSTEECPTAAGGAFQSRELSPEELVRPVVTGKRNSADRQDRRDQQRHEKHLIHGAPSVGPSAFLTALQLGGQ